MSRVGDVGKRSAPQAQVQEKPKEKPEAAEKPKEKPDVEAAKEKPEVEAIEAAKEQPEVQAPSEKPKDEIPETYYKDEFDPSQLGEQTQGLRDGAPPRPLGTTEVSASHDIKTSEVSGIRVEASAKTTNAKVEPGLNNTVTIEASASIGDYVGVEAGKEGQLTAGSARLKGQKFTYETKVSQEQADAIRTGTADLPNPFDPLNMPEGSAAVFKGQNYVSTEFEGAYRHIATEAKVTDLRGAGMAVEKLDGNRVKITSGSVNAIENEAFFGAGGKNWAVGLKNKQGLENTSMRMAELDLSTQEGMDKYQRFLITGQVPEADGNTVTRSGTTQSLKLNSETSLRGNLGPVDINLQFMGNEGERKTTQYTDGSKSDELTLSYDQSANLTISKDFDFRGAQVEDPDKPTYALTMGQVDPRSSSYLASAFAEDPDSAEALSYQGQPTQDAQISFTTAQAQEMQRLATEYVQRHNPGPNTADTALTGTSAFMQQIAEARNSDEVAAVFAKATSNGSIAEHLLNLRAEPENAGRPLPGTLKLQNSP